MGLLLTIVIVVSWYLSNIGLLLLNKFLISSFGFKYPVFLTLLHMVACTVISYLGMLTKLSERQPIRSRQQLYKITVIALVFCACLVLGNTSLRYIPVSFNQAVGSTTPAFTALFAITMTNKYESKEVYASLVPVVLGIVIASGFEPNFHLYGFTACLLATAARAFKSVLQGLLLTDPNEKMNSMNLLLYMAPITVVALVPLTLIMESQPWQRAYDLCRVDQRFAAALFLNVALAYFVNLANFLVTKHTSALTLQVLGNAKGVIAAGVSVALFKNQLSHLGVMGYLITVGGVFWYSETKRRARASLVKAEAEKLPLITDGPDSFKPNLASPNRTAPKQYAPEKQSS